MSEKVLDQAPITKEHEYSQDNIGLKWCPTLQLKSLMILLKASQASKFIQSSSIPKIDISLLQEIMLQFKFITSKENR